MMEYEGVPVISTSKFVSQKELDEARQRRQAEWEKARAADPSKADKPPDEDAAYDPRPLFERLAEQKLRKQEEFEAQFKMTNYVSLLDEEDAQYLDEISTEMRRTERERRREEERELQAFRAQARNVVGAPPPEDLAKPRTSIAFVAAGETPEATAPTEDDPDRPRLVRTEPRSTTAPTKKDLQKQLLGGGGIVRKRKSITSDDEAPVLTKKASTTSPTGKSSAPLPSTSPTAPSLPKTSGAGLLGVEYGSDDDNDA